jgi:hypothetical protein
MRNHLTEAQNELASEMGQISESGYCAGWMFGLEFRLWKILSEGPCEFGAIDITSDQSDRLRTLSDLCGGWIAWDDSIVDRNFVPMLEWQRRFAEWRSQQSC